MLTADFSRSCPVTIEDYTRKLFFFKLAVRYARSSETAMRFAEHFSSHPAVDRVAYPGLAGHPRHDLAARQMTGGFGGMLSVMVNGGSNEISFDLSDYDFPNDDTDVYSNVQEIIAESDPNDGMSLPAEGRVPAGGFWNTMLWNMTNWK